ncbi:T9SS type A sorting domain-containing protein [Fluviicola sp.]|uniref:T9SS type A sorting domain-containing protein n=1 Tax=Fluviicola sp. TaxID=1917219 RepID=UPI002624420C|nr:T9SS type A sorting domain-containing protein [Fluviicola sp.]
MKTCFTFFSCFIFLNTFSQNVSLDNYFGNSGVVITNQSTEINSMAVAADGAVFSSGYHSLGNGSDVYRLTVSKHNSNGSIASNFGTNGLVYTEVEYSEFPLDITLQPDGKILTAGSAYMGPTQMGPGDHRSFIVRYLPNGTIDSSFATNGIFVSGYTDSHFNSILLQGNGSMLLVGNAGGQTCITKLTANGILDPAYGNGGVKFLGDANYFLVNWGGISLNDGSVLLYGYEGSDYVNTKVSCAKVDLQGNLVTSFGQGGKVILDTYDSDTIIGSVTELISKAIELPDGKIILNGFSVTGLVIKLNADGSLNSAFGSNGIRTHNYKSKDMEIQQDGKILLGGSREVSEYNYGFTITRLLANGNLDPGFNGTGSFTVDFSPGNDYLQTMKLLDSGNKLLVGGSSRDANSIAHFMHAQIDLSQSLSLSENSTGDLSVYPNPFTHELTFSFDGNELSGIQLIDPSGRVVSTFEHIENNKLQLDHLSNGMYQLVLTKKSGETKTIKVAKQ